MGNNNVVIDPDITTSGSNKDFISTNGSATLSTTDGEWSCTA